MTQTNQVMVITVPSMRHTTATLHCGLRTEKKVIARVLATRVLAISPSRLTSNYVALRTNRNRVALLLTLAR